MSTETLQYLLDTTNNIHDLAAYYREAQLLWREILHCWDGRDCSWLAKTILEYKTRFSERCGGPILGLELFCNVALMQSEEVIVPLHYAIANCGDISVERAIEKAIAGRGIRKHCDYQDFH